MLRALAVLLLKSTGAKCILWLLGWTFLSGSYPLLLFHVGCLCLLLVFFVFCFAT